MKTSILIICTVLTTFGLTAYSYMAWGDSAPPQAKTASCQTVFLESDFRNLTKSQTDFEFVYEIESRFMSRVTKKDLLQAKSITDVLPAQATESVVSYKNVEVCILLDDQQIREKGSNETLNAAQLQLLRSADYSTNFYLSASCQRRNAATGALEKDTIIYYMTVIPEREASYNEGMGTLLEYLKSNSEEETAIVRKDQLKPGQVYFTVTKEGIVEHVKLNSSSGYTSVDETMLELITTMPGTWEPATNGQGEKVDQQLVYFFGLKGC